MKQMGRNIDNSHQFNGGNLNKLVRAMGHTISKDNGSSIKTGRWGLDSTSDKLQTRENFYESQRNVAESVGKIALGDIGQF